MDEIDPGATGWAARYPTGAEAVAAGQARAAVAAAHSAQLRARLSTRRIFGATGLTTLIAAIASVPVTWWLTQPPRDPYHAEYIDWAPVEAGPLWLCVLFASVASAAFATSMGGFAARLSRTLGSLLAVAIGWALAISLLTVATRWLRVPLVAIPYCTDGCTAALVGMDQWSGVYAWALNVLMSAVLLAPPALGIVLLAGAWWFDREGMPIVGTLLVTLSVGALNAWSLLWGGILPYVILAAGAMVWSTVLYGRAGLPSAAAASVHGPPPTAGS